MVLCAGDCAVPGIGWRMVLLVGWSVLGFAAASGNRAVFRPVVSASAGYAAPPRLGPACFVRDNAPRRFRAADRGVSQIRFPRYAAGALGNAAPTAGIVDASSLSDS